MADEKESILFTIGIDLDQATKALKSAQDDMATLNKEVDALQKNFNAGSISSAAYGQALTALKAKQEAVSASLAVNTKVVNDHAKSEASAQLIIANLQAQVASLTNATTVNSKAQKDHQNAVKDGQTGLLDYAKTVLSTTENTSTFAEKIDTFKEKLSNVKSGLEAAKAGLTGIKGAIAATGIGLLLLALNALYTYLTKTKDGMEFVEKATRTVGAVFGFVEEKVAGIGKAIFTAFNDPKQAIVDLGNLIKENLLNRFTSFGVILEAIQTHDWSKLMDGIAQLGTGVTGVTGKVRDLATEAGRAVDENEAFYQKTKKLEDSERDLNVERSRSAAQINALKFIADDTTKAIGERVKAAREAFAIENGITQKQIALQQQRVNLIKEEGKLDPTKDLDDKLAEAQSKLADIRAQSLVDKKKLNNLTNGLDREAQQQTIEAQLATMSEGLRLTKERGFQTLQLEEQILAKQLELSLVGVVKNSELETTLRLKAKTDLAQLILNNVIEEDARLAQVENDQTQARLNDVKKGGQEELVIQKIAIQQHAFQEEEAARLTIKNQEALDARLREIHSDANAKLREIDQQSHAVDINDEKARAESRLARSKEGSREELNATIDNINAARDASLNNAKLSADQTIAVNDDANRQIANAQKAFRKKQIDQVLSLAASSAQGISQVIEASIKTQTAALDRQQATALKSAGLSAELRAGIEKNYAEKREALERNAAERRRKIATAENLISVAQGLTNAITKNVDDPFLQVIETALVLATGVAQQQVISSQKFEFGGALNEPKPKLAKGGPVFGPSHKQGGIQMYHKSGAHMGEFEDNEIILTKGVYQNPYLRAQASAINVAGGGRSFSEGSVTARPKFSHYSLGGMLPTPQSSGIGLSVNDVELAMSNAVRKMNFPQQVVYVSDIQTKSAQVVKVASKSDI